ncbi:MAG: TRAP transporter substrate-binding protein DctP [Pseudomonadota bacterium]|nr:TRAP transporter substrate-binding protein DctP [Pseudomonadota bacterium]
MRSGIVRRRIIRLGILLHMPAFAMTGYVFSESLAPDAESYTVESSTVNQVELLVNQIAPPNHFYFTEVIEPWGRSVSEVTGGRVKLRHTLASMGSYRRNFDMAWAGIVDIAGGNQSATPGRFAVTQINESPNLASNRVQALSVALWRTHQKYLHLADEFSGTHLLSLHTGGTHHWYTRDKPIRNLADIKGMKIAAPSDIGAKMLAAMGAIPVFLTAPEIHDGLSRGILDGVSLPATGVTRLGLTPYINYQTRLANGAGLSFGGFFLTINTTSWARISSQDQKAILSISGEHFARRAAVVFDREMRQSEADLYSSGVEVVVTDKGFDAELRRSTNFIDAQWIDSAQAAGLQAHAALRYFHQQVREEARTLAAPLSANQQMSAQ